MSGTLIAAYMPAWKDPPEAVTIPTWGNGPWINTPPINYMGDHPERWPSYGAVNEDNQSIIDQQLVIAANANITAFAVNWYAGWAVEYGIQRLLASTSASPVKAFVQWSNHFDSMDAAHCNKPFLYEGIRLAALYMRSPAPRYYKRNGRPVLALFSSQALDDTIRITGGHDVTYTPSTAERNALVADIRNVVGNVLTGDTTGGIVGSTVSASSNPGPFLVIYDRGWAPVVGVDAMTMYSQHNIVLNPGSPSQTIRMAHSYAEIDTGCRQTWGTGSNSATPNGKEYWPTIMTGWDRTPWGGTAGDASADNCQPSEAQFLAHCQAAKTAMQAVSANGTAFVYNFNENGEAYPINPTSGSGTMYVDVLNSVFPMSFSNIVPKSWTLAVSFDNKRWTNYPAGDKPSGYRTTPQLISTSHKGISLVNNYNGQGGWIRIYGRAFGRSADLGTAAGAIVKFRDPAGDNLWHAVYSHLSLNLPIAGSGLQIQSIECQIGTLGGGITAGRALDVMVTVNGVNSNILTARVVSQPGHFFFINNVTGNDATGIKNDPTKPYRYAQFYSGGANFTGIFAPGVMKAGDTIVMRDTGTDWVDQVGFDGRFIRFAIGTGASTDAINGGSIPTGAASHGYVTIGPYPGEHPHCNFPTGGGIHGCEGVRALAGNGQYVQVYGMDMETGALAGRDAAAINLEAGANHWVVCDNKCGPWPSSVTGVNSAKAAGVVGQGDSMEIIFNECFGYASTSNESHGIYLGGASSGGFEACTTNSYVGYNWCHDCVGGSGIQQFWLLGVNYKYFTGNTIENNVVEDTLKYGINLADSSVSASVRNNITRRTGLNAFRVACPSASELTAHGGLSLAINCCYNTFYSWNTTGSIHDAAVYNEGYIDGGFIKISHNVITAAAGRPFSNTYYENQGAAVTTLSGNQNIWYDLAGTLSAVPSWDATAITTSPQLTNAPTDLTRQAGAEITTTELIVTTLDIFGISRPQGAHKWVGACEGVGT